MSINLKLEPRKDTEMTTFRRQAAQGDLLITKVDSLPKGLTKAKAENGKHVLAHSETGHHHTVLEKSAQLLIDETNEFIAYLEVSNDVDVTHERSFDTHAPLTLTPGNYEIRRQREYVPEGYRRAAD